MSGKISRDNTVLPDLILDEILDDADALLLIGGNSWRCEEAKQVVPFAKEFRGAEKLVGFISDAVYFAAENGFLNDIKHTGNDPEELKEATGYTGSEKYVLENALVDQGIVTAKVKLIQRDRFSAGTFLNGTCQ